MTQNLKETLGDCEAWLARGMQRLRFSHIISTLCGN
jgi:hypothetical protein